MNVRRSLLGLAASLSLVHVTGATDAPRGADVPWATCEAEQAKTTGKVLGPDYTGHTAMREASGRRCVRLASTGEFAEFKAKTEAQGLVVRYNISDSADGQGIDATLSLYINGKLASKLPMTSRLAYLYGAYPFNNVPSAGTPRHFWDELRLMPGAIHSGDSIRLQKDADDKAAQYLIDFIDLETVPAAIEKPANSISITDFGATANDQSDDRPAFLAAIAQAKSNHKSVWIPAGEFVVKGPLEVSDVEIRGAGMWYSTLIGASDYSSSQRISISGNGSNVTLADFAINGNLNYRNDAEPNDGLGGSFGTGSKIQNIWVEHTKTGAWLVNSDGLIVEGCRFRDTIADGINLCLGMRNTIVRNCTARGGGDDCFAMWPATYAKSIYQPGGNRFVNCTAQLPFLAQGFSIYGGDANSVENCQAIDISYGAGIFASTTFPTESGFREITNYRRITITRSGGSDGAIGTVANLVDLKGLNFEDIDVIDSPTDGIKFTSINGRILKEAKFDRIRITNPAGYGIVEASGAVGSATISNVTVINPKTSGRQDNASAFNLIQGAGNSGVENTKQSSADIASARRTALSQ